VHIVRYLAGDAGPAVGVLDPGGVRPVAAGSLAALLARPLPEIRALTEQAASVPYDARPFTLLAPADGRTEVWAAGVTYQRSREARVEESGGATCYDLVYDAARPELFFKSAGWRAVTGGQPVAVRRDSAVTVPEAELAIVLNAFGEVIGYTVCDDVSSRDIEGENPLYLPQAKIYDGACALAPGIRPAWEVSPADLAISVSVSRDGAVAWSGRSSSSQLKRPLDELARYLFASQDFPDGAILSTGTGIVPGLEFTLTPGDTVTIEIDQVGTLVNPVVAGKG
jgi:2-dehydro-3-deoxy-D-arabinonate dehydratase